MVIENTIVALYHELKMGINLNITTYAKMVAFSLIAGTAQNFVSSGS